MADYSCVPAVVTYLVNTFTAASTLGAASPPVVVRTGPQLGSFAPLVLWVAIDDPYGTQGGVPAGAHSEQEWAGMPARLRNEVVDIYCCAEAWSGGTDTLTAMNAAYGITAAVETLLLADVGLGGNVLFEFPGFTGADLRWHQGDGGCAAQVLFRIAVKARLGH